MSLFGRRERREIAEQDAYIDRLRRQRNKAIKDVETWKSDAKRTAELYTDTSIVNDHLTEDLTTVREELAAERGVSESLARQIQELADRLRAHESEDSGDESWRSRYEAEKARVLDLTDRLLASEERARTAVAQATVEGRPVDGAPHKPSSVEAQLRAALHRSEKAREALDEQCRTLQAANEADARELQQLREGAAS